MMLARVLASRAVLLVFLAALACGGSKPEQSAITLGLSEGSEVQLRTGETLYVFLIAIGAADSAVTFTVDGGPAYVTIEGNALRISPPRSERSATFVLGRLLGHEDRRHRAVRRSLLTEISMLATATSGGHTVRQRYTVLVTNLAADACMP